MLLPLIPLTSSDVESIRAAASELSLANTGIVLEFAGHAVPEAAAVKGILRSCKAQVGPFTLSQASLAASYLDSGAIRVLFDGGSASSWSSSDEASAAAKEDFVEILKTLPKARVGVILSVDGEGELVSDAAVTEIAAVASALFLRASSAATLAVERLKAIHKKLGAEACLSLLLPAAPADAAAEAVGKLHAGADCHVSFPGATIDLFASCFSCCARTDRDDGLFTTVVADECGKALGLVYSSKESLVEAIKTRRGTYYSRSRGGLWRKGDTSGAIQELRGIALDCDNDALLFTVKQRGDPPAFCHLNCRTCWGEDGGLTALQRVLESRKALAPAGSYTKRLFDDATLLKNKLLEEAQELSEALAEEEDTPEKAEKKRDHVAAETADLVYFALVAATKAGVSLAEVEAHLDARALKITRRPGNAKEERIKAAEAHFAAAAAKGSNSTGAGAGGAAAV